VALPQVPAPLQTRALLWVPLEQEAPTQMVPDGYFWHAPAPSQTPLLPHEAAPWSAHSESGSVPPEIAPHLPSLSPVLEPTQALQMPPQAFSQHTPSTQAPEEH
jgi:hypothetical protein